jgi:protein O-GlcNAc transferase
MNIKQTLQQAISHHKAGKFQQAEPLYRAILTAAPKHPDANHNLGVILKQGKQLESALDFFKTAVQANPTQSQFWISYIDTLIHLEQLSAAHSILDQAQSMGLKKDVFDLLSKRLQSDPKKIKSTNQTLKKTIKPEQFIVRAKAHEKKGQFTEARQLYRSVLEAFPQNLQAKKALKKLQENTTKENQATPSQAQLDAVIKLYSKGQIQETLECVEILISEFPNEALLYNISGACYTRLGLLVTAVNHYQQALTIKPDYAEAHSNLGNRLKELGQLDMAIKHYEKALTINPDSAEVYYNLGNTLKELGQLDAAVKRYNQALNLTPNYVEAHYNLGNTLKKLGHLSAAAKQYSQVLAINPDYAQAHYNLGNTHKELSQFNAAVKHYEQALKINPNHVEAWNNLGNRLKELGQLDTAIKRYDQALSINPDYAEAYSNRLFAFNYHSTYDSDTCYREACKFGEIFSKKVASQFSHFQCSSMPKILKIGLVSGDLREHPVGHFLESIVSPLSQGKVELIAYTTDPKSDNLTARIKPYFSDWKSLYELTDEMAANLIYKDGVHILIDLSGHTAHNRLPVFSFKPAPIQISWLGYFATTGLAEIDYIVGDQHVTPLNSQGFFVEKIWQLPETRWCFTAPKHPINCEKPPVLHQKHITFGCFNNYTKLNNKVIALWAKILNHVNSSRLFLKANQFDDQTVRKDILERFLAYGINAERITIEGFDSRENYLLTYHHIDIALDPFPFTGGTTTMEALWMGVPVLTLQGESLVSRQGIGILMNAGLPNWIARNEDEYITKAIRFSTDLGNLTSLRSGLRQQVLASPLFDAPLFSDNFEKALWAMWRQRIDDNKNTT